jgi:zinc/manganese transport system permease protein
MLFLALVVLNLVAGMQALGTLLSIGLMMLPAAASRFWVASVGGMMLLATSIAILSSALGLVASFHFDLPSGPSVVLGAGAIYVFPSSARGIVPSLLPAPHLEH